jgi:hypothetical protein
MHMKRLAISVLWTAVILTAQIVPVVEHKQAAPRKTNDTFLSGAPFSLQQTLKLLHQSAIPMPRRKEAIQNRGLDFVASSETLDKLKAAGASEDMLKVIKVKAKQVVAELPKEIPAPAPPPPPKREPAGSLAVNCGPGECEINLNGAPRGSTSNGTLTIGGLAPGEWAVDFRSDGYVSHQTTVTVEDEKTASIAAVLDPNRETQEKFGAELFQKVVLALGAGDGAKDLASVQATGGVTIWTCDGRSARWAVLMRNRPDRALFQAMFGKAYFQEVVFTGSESQTGKKKVNDAAQIATDFGLIRNNQLAALIAKLGSPSYKMVTSHPVPVAGEEFSLVAEGGDEKVSISLDQDLLPQRIRIVTSAKTGSLEISYSDYTNGDKGRFPKSMQVKPDGWQHPVDVHFDSVELGPALNDSDYKARGKRLANLGE